MEGDIPVETRWLFASLVTVMLGALMYSGAIQSESGLIVLVGMLSALGLYERRGRRVLEKKQE